MTIKLIISTFLITLELSCNVSIKQNGDGTALTIDHNAMANYKWAELVDTANTQVYYLQLNFLGYPDDNYIGKDITDFKDSIPNSSFVLTTRQRQGLLNLVTDTSNFTPSDCGTFHLNAGFVIVEHNNIQATISIGCGYNQWYFNPYNQISNHGAFNKKGFKQMEKLLDDINLTN